MNIQSLLNPSNEGSGCLQPLSPMSAAVTRCAGNVAPPFKRQKLAKDAAIFAKAKARGDVNYPPHEAGNDEELAAQHRAFRVFPMGHIAEYCRHIPYNSEKKLFLAKTGREAFEVFQYTFKNPGDEREYTVMWDYNIGLVRITPFFKCCKYSKTTPARVLNLNHGLREISHSITGGALAAQGYWMPFDAAKAVAATFCWDIRFALTPLFGKDFPEMCTLPSDANFGNFKIDRRIVRKCTNEAQNWRRMKAPTTSSSTRTSTSSGSVSSTSSSAATSEGRVAHRVVPSSSPVEGMMRTYTSTPSTLHNSSMSPVKHSKPMLSHRHTDIESGYGTDTDRSDKFLCSPQGSPPRHHDWIAVNRTSCPQQSYPAPHFHHHQPAHRQLRPMSSSTHILASDKPFGLGESPHPWLSSVPSRVSPSANDFPLPKISSYFPHQDSASRAAAEQPIKLPPLRPRLKRALSEDRGANEATHEAASSADDNSSVDSYGSEDRYGSGLGLKFPTTKGSGGQRGGSSDGEKSGAEEAEAEAEAKKKNERERETKAAQLMMQLSVADAGLK